MSARQRPTSELTFDPTWESLRKHSVPSWFGDAKFGIFIHWGVYSVPAFANEWYPRFMYQQGSPQFQHHRATWGDQAQFGYKDFIPLFKGERFDPDGWVDVFSRAGARYLVVVAEHHDGFAMYDTARSEWNALKMGPKRDVVGELTRAAHLRGLVPGVSNHRAEHWWFFDGGRTFPSDVMDPRYDALYGPAAMASPDDVDSPAWKGRDWQPRPDARFLEDWLGRCCELVDKYQPQVFYFDWWIEQAVFEPYLQRFAAYYYNRASEWGKEVVLQYKFEAFPKGTALYDIERGKLAGIREDHWQTDTSVSYQSWGYVDDDEFKSPTIIVHDLVDIVSKNGNLLLNVGPKPDGTIPDKAASLLLDLGAWLGVNAEAIYGTHPWHGFGEGGTTIVEGHLREREDKAFNAEDVRFTTKGDCLYAICLGWPGETARMKSLGSHSAVPASAIEQIQMLGSNQPLAWSQDESGLQILTPSHRPCDHAYAFRIRLKHGEM